MKIFLSSLEGNTSYNADCWLCNLDADMVCRRLQLQEKICSDIADVMTKVIGGDVIVYAEGEHSCITARGIRKVSAVTRTISYRGAFQQEESREEFFRMMKLRRN